MNKPAPFTFDHDDVRAAIDLARHAGVNVCITGGQRAPRVRLSCAVRFEQVPGVLAYRRRGQAEELTGISLRNVPTV